MNAQNKPWYWIPVLNFASGLPYTIIISASVVMYKNLGVSNADIGFYTSLLYLPWVIKPFWSPVVEAFATKKKWFAIMQFIIGIAFLLVGLILGNQHFFMLTLALFWVAAFASATNDIAIDGYYLEVLSKDQQSFFLGIRSTFYRIALLTGNGLIVYIAGSLEKTYSNPEKAWSYTMIFVACLMLLVAIYNFVVAPKEQIDKNDQQNRLSPSFSTIIVSFFQKKQLLLVISFILIFRLGEAQLMKMLVPFLLDKKSVGGLELSTEEVGLLYGTFGVLALVIGGILGGIVISKHGLKKVMFPMFLAMHLPIFGFIFLAYLQPESHVFITIAIALEQFGYGFGFAAFMMYLIYVADGVYKTAHYALASGLMGLGMMLPGMISGDIQKYLGYENFFIWVLLATIPGLILSRFLVFPADFGKKTT
jgi:MFS transporter, PAT family, beta-lactamase induction signal transducer AmpG